MAKWVAGEVFARNFFSPGASITVGAEKGACSEAHPNCGIQRNGWARRGVRSCPNSKKHDGMSQRNRSPVGSEAIRLGAFLAR